MRSRITGAELTLPSRTMAKRFPTFCSVTCPKMRAPCALNVKDT